MTAGASLLGEAELHGLVDGHLPSERRADVLRKLAASPADRALVEGWQEQNDLIRAAFRDVENEALPVALDLAPPRLRCIDGGMERDVARPLPPLHAPVAPSSRRTGRLATAAALLVVAAGLSASWLIANQPQQDLAHQDNAPAAPQTSTEAALADRATTALEGTRNAAGLSTLRVPDLAAAGLQLTGVSAPVAGEPAGLVLRYRGAHEAQIVLSISSMPDTATTTPTVLGKALVWRHAGTVYALAGTLPVERLRTLARSLQDGTAQD